MDLHEERATISRRVLLKRAAQLGSLAGLASLVPVDARAATAASAAIPFWTVSDGALPSALPINVPIVLLPTGLSQSETLRIAAGISNVDESSTSPGAGFLEQTELLVLGGHVTAMSIADNLIDVAVQLGPRFHIVAFDTDNFYPYPIWDDEGKLVTMYLTTGEAYDQAVPASWGIDFPLIKTTFDFHDQTAGALLGTIDYDLPTNVVASTFPTLSGIS